jgi:hypothetical protein
LLFLFAVAAAQRSAPALPPVPPNPLDPITSSVHLLTSPAERASALDLLTLAGQNFTLGRQGEPDTTLSVSLQSYGSLNYEGLGTMTQVWAGGRRTWWADFDNQVSGIAYPLKTNPVPLRVAQARAALLWPLSPWPTRQQLRVAAASVAGVPATCVLVTRAALAPASPGRDWREAEYCIAANRQLLLASPAPGIFYRYDYSQPLTFAGHRLPSAIHLIEGQQVVLEIELTRFGAPTAADLDALHHSPPRPGILSELTGGRYTRVDQLRMDEACVLEFTVGVTGRILESEAIPNGYPAFEQQTLRRLRLHFYLPSRRTEQVYLWREGGP